MRKIIGSLLFIAGMLGPVAAYTGFPSEDFIVLDIKQIQALTDEQLVEKYVDVLAEIEASKTFHVTSGFTPREYSKYRDLIKYRYQLLFDANRRKVEVPAAAR